MSQREKELLELSLIVESAMRRADSLNLGLSGYLLSVVQLDISSMPEMDVAIDKLRDSNGME